MCATFARASRGGNEARGMIEAEKRAIFSRAEWDEAFAAATDIREWTDGPDPEWWQIQRLAKALLEERERIAPKSFHSGILLQPAR